ncbi:MAG TPA: hypothetical protein VGK27_01425 [Candidatus Deferrimicrobiaceae bacterium]|jgi:hypothetical protein
MKDDRNVCTDARLDRLFALAREAPVDTAVVERNFETRLLARIRERSVGREPWYAWGWRLMPLFLAITLLLGGWTIYHDPFRMGDPALLFSGPEQVALVDSLTGE